MGTLNLRSVVKDLDALISRLGISAPEAKAYLRQLEIDQRSADAAADMARGSTLALRARNAQRPFLDELADADLTPEPKLTPRDLARKANDDARRDAQYGPFPAGSPGVMWDIKRAAERGIDEARAAAAQAERYKPVNRSQLTHDAANAALALGAGSLAGAAAVEAMRAADPAGDQERARSGLAASLPSAAPDATGATTISPADAAAALRVAGRNSPPTAQETAGSGLFANLPPISQPQQDENLAASATPVASDPPLTAKKSKDPNYLTTNANKLAEIRKSQRPAQPASAPVATDPVEEPTPFLLSAEEQELENERQLAAFAASAAANAGGVPAGSPGAQFSIGQPARSDIPPQYQEEEPAASEKRSMQENRYWNNPALKERKIARMAKKAGLTMEEARALVADGGVRADGMTDDAFNLTSQGRAEEFRGLRDAVTDKRNADANARMERYKAQAMLAGANPNKNLVNALGMLAPEDQQSALQFMLAGRRGATPLDVDAQQAFANRGIAQAQVENEGQMARLEKELALRSENFDKQLAQSEMQLKTDRELRLEAMERQSNDALNRIAAQSAAQAQQDRINNDARMQAALAQIMGSNRNAQIEADARLQGTRLEADAMRERFAKPAEMMQVQAALASKNAERRANLMAAAQQEANNYGYDTGSWMARALTPGWDSALVTKPEQDKIRAYLRAVDPQATNAEIEQVLTAALRNKKREM